MSNNNFMDELRDKLAVPLRESPLFFIAAEAERGLGLEKVLSNYFIVSTKQDSIARQLEFEHRGLTFSEVSSTSKLSESGRFLEYLKSNTQGFLSANKKCYLQYFKHTDTSLAEKISAEGYSVEVLNNSPDLTRELENKIKQYQLLAEAGLGNYIPESEVKVIKDIDLPELMASEQNSYVVQLPFGHTGLSTYFLHKSEQEHGLVQLQKIQKQFPNRIAKVARWINGYPFTVNGCIYRGKPYIAGLSYQFTGLPGLTAISAATVGNDWSLPEQLLTRQQRSDILRIASEVGQLLSLSKGFKGIFGIDLIVEANTGKIYLLEVNPRQVASISMHSILQAEQEQIPLLALHLAEFLGVEIEIDNLSYGEKGMEPIQAGQVFLRSLKRQEYTFPEVEFKPGIYRQQSDNAARELISAGRGSEVIFLDAEHDRPLIWQKDGKSLTDFGEDGFLLVSKSPGEVIGFNDEIARLQFRRSVGMITGSQVQVLPLVQDAFAKLRSIIEH